MYHSLLIDGKNTYEEWGLIPTSRPVVSMPEVRVYQVEIPGLDGLLDYTELMTGGPVYSQRTGSWEFYLRPGYGWVNVFSAIANTLHGLAHTVILEDDPDYSYHGRITVNEWRSEQKNSILVLNYNLDPFKVNQNGDKIL